MSTSGNLVKESLGLLVPVADEFSIAFYRTLFRKFPEVRPMFPEEMEGQRKKLIQAVALVATHADRIGEISPALQNLGARHTSYGVEPAHYGAVKDALMGTLEEMLGNQFDVDLSLAWSETIDQVAEQMLIGHYAALATA